MHVTHGLPLPESIKNAPELLPGLDLFLIAWFQLLGYADGDKIDYRTVCQYADENGFRDGQRARLIDYIGELNSVYAQIMDRKRERERKRREREAKHKGKR